jgi:hypothetical protein
VPFDSLAIYVTRGSNLLPRYATGKSTSLFLLAATRDRAGVAGWVALHGKPIRNGNPATETGAFERFGPERGAEFGLGRFARKLEGDGWSVDGLPPRFRLVQ